MPAPALPALQVSPALPRRVDLLVVGLAESGLRGVPEAVEKAYVKRFGMGTAEMATSVGARTAAGSRRTLPATGDGPQLMVIGLGDGEPGTEDLRRAAGSAVRQAGTAGAEGRSLAVSLSFGTTSVDELEAVAEGALIGSYRYAPISGKDAPTPSVDTVTVLHPRSTRGAGSTDVTSVAPVVARAVVTAREWVNVPPNLLYPESFADEVQTLVKDAKVTVEVLDGPALTKGGYGGILAVGGGSSRPPRLVRLSYRPRGAKQHLALVGKGITFDSGGLNLKPGDSMYTMKCDMAGAAAVLAATHAIARLGLAVNVTAYAAMAENLPSDTAYRPSDVLTMYGGTTVENGNTDAEGRLVMADALARAGEDKPDLVVDVATLTGACIVALGDRTSGLMATDDETADRILDAAEAAGEDFWQLPIPKETRGKLDSKVADLRSTGGDRYGGALVAAAFLREFVPAGTPWAHLDIAGPAYYDGKPYGYVSPGGTGVAVRTLIALARSLTTRS
ncbi:leucyl aminopeptidase [uncultured Friedmanniella sp.]|uniref:leucyl aminopeptidase n=1 Tax=uncultured Friedmanniella sp. TaxID=335381 RepID=UPI0035C9F42D